MKKYIIFLFLNLPFKDIIAQAHSVNHDLWSHYFGKFNLSPKSSLSFETSFRYANGLQEKQQYFIRPSFDYKISKSKTISMGYSHYKTYVYGEPSLNSIPIPENHVWLQTTFVNQISKLKITNRLRDENRWVGVKGNNSNPNNTNEIVDYVYRNRLRHMFLASLPIGNLITSKPLNFFVGNEAFVNIGKNSGKTFMNQNRIIAGVGLSLDSHWQVQLSYIHQNIWNFNNTLKETNPTLRLSLYSNFNLYKIRK